MVEQRADMLWTVNRTFALIMGIIFLLLGIIGFFTPTENSTGVQAVLGIFDADTTLNIIYVLTGIIALAAAFMGFSRTFNQIFGVVYTLLGVLGLIPALYFPAGSYGQDSGLFLGLMHLSVGDHVLHLIVGIAALVVSFFFAGSMNHTTPRSDDTM